MRLVGPESVQERFWRGGPAVYRLQGANNGTTPATKYDLNADFVTLLKPRTAETLVIVPTSAVVNDLTVDDTQPNGRDQAGAFSNDSWIYFYYVLTTQGVLRSRSSASTPAQWLTAPGLKNDEIAWAFVGAVRFGTGALHTVRLAGRTAYYMTRQNVLTNGSATVETNISLATFVPPIALEAILDADLRCSAADDNFATAELRLVTGATFKRLIGERLSSGTEGIGAGDSAQVILPNIGQNVIYLVTGAGNIDLSVWVQGYTLPNGG